MHFHEFSLHANFNCIAFVPRAAGFYEGSVDHADALMPCRSSQSSPESVNA